ncbi:antibiotic biosynthesis monooxygenase family protein [Thalassospira xiamenensis]|uniref:Antibiotic biosynthesis monooxygenase n=1 Tax=Thalassospira xiamenensis TaxID=220697 RepID=A0A285R5C9_9PROT|nr:antibiotic biosynthesis monooxygenase family protein [Thalassospira xiamenensis]SOB89326.1 Antibiotic biosynthesis monooxygenase [Thalassospira xiamenensis]
MTKNAIAGIDPTASYLTLFNIYDVAPENQRDLARLLSEITESTIRHEPGFVSVSIHSSLDGKKVVNYAQWASKNDFETFMQKPETQASLKQFAAIAQSVSPGLYHVDQVHCAKNAA